MNFCKYCLVCFISFGACSQDSILKKRITAPKLLEAKVLNASSVQLIWINSNPEEQDAQLLERKMVVDTDYVEIASIDPETNTYLDKGLASETGYVYRIRAEKAGTYSDFSNEAGVTTYPQVADGEFLVLDTLFKGGSTGSKTNPSRFLAYADHTASLGKYGGWTAVQLAATGKFRTEKYNGTWHLVDPDGYLFFGMACNSIKAESEYNSVTLPDDLLEVGFNHLGNWSDYEAINAGSKKIPYTFRELFLSGYKNTSQRTKDLYSKGIIAVFDSEFTAFADELAQVVAQQKDDPYCIGVFSDNELPIYTNETYGELLDRYLTISDKTDPNYKAADVWMVARKGIGYTPDEQDRLEWHGKLMSTYYQIVNTAIKKYAPDMLYLGSRLHGGAKTKNSIFRDSAPYVDVFSVNYYGKYDPHEEFVMWVSESNKPFLISEFYGKGFDVNLDNSTGAGYHVPTQQDRALYFENIVIRFLESDACIGYQWHKFQDDNSNRGLVNKQEQWYEELRQSLIKMNKDIYNFRIYLRSN